LLLNQWIKSEVEKVPWQQFLIFQSSSAQTFNISFQGDQS
jgi:hypothetical protein